jgi:NADPH oxidase 2
MSTPTLVGSGASTPATLLGTPELKTPKSAVPRLRRTSLDRLLDSGQLMSMKPRELSRIEKMKIWAVNQGASHMVIGIFIFAELLLFALFFVHYTYKDNMTINRKLFGWTFVLSRSSAEVLQFNAALILLPVCRTLISLLRETPLNGIIPFDKNLTFHKLVGYSMSVFTLLHVVGHWNNFGRLASKYKLGFVGFLRLNFLTGPGWTGYVMLLCLLAMTITAIDKARRKNFERFWYTHHLFTIFFVFWSIHGSFCLLRRDIQTECASSGNFYIWWMFGAVLYLLERVAREIRGRHTTYISKVIQHPSNVVEIQMFKEKTKVKAGQYIFINVPAVSAWQYHPFTLTSAPEEDHLSVHVRMVGDFTKELGKMLGCADPSSKKRPAGPQRAFTVMNRKANGANAHGPQLFPNISIDGPYSTASEDVFKYETAILVGAGIGITPFASILKSTWYRMSNPDNWAQNRLRKVYFFWICRDFGSLAWFRSLLSAIEEQDKMRQIEVRAYLTAKISHEDALNIQLNYEDRDPVTGLITPTNFGRPNWDMAFRGIKKLHCPGEAGVFFCGPEGLGSELALKCNQYSEPGEGGFEFHFGKENF